MSNVINLVKETEVPQMVPVKQYFDHSHISDLRKVIEKSFREKLVEGRIAPGMSIAITGGSRGIRDITVILSTVVEYLKLLGAYPFIVPAMGSHGGATAKGQSEMLRNLGITEESVGCPIKSSMEVTMIGTTEKGKPIFIDSNAAKADGIVVINRVKAHTSFTGKYESGLMKMMAVGLGKQKGAHACHCEGHGKMAEHVEEYGKGVLQYANILFGIAILENAYDQIRNIELLFPEEFIRREPELLIEAKNNMPKIYLTDLDVLIVERMGKDISGLGMDPHVTGAFVSKYAWGPKRPSSLVVLDMTEKAHGNGTGIGVADITTQRLVDKIDFDATYANVLTAVMPRAARIPLIAENQQTAIQTAIYTSGCTDYSKLRMVKISDTLHVEKIWVTSALLKEVQEDSRMEVIGEMIPLPFNNEGNLF